MTSIKVTVSTVDGGLMEWNEDTSIVSRLNRLRNDGYQGRALVDALITDDWGPPPSHVRLSGKLDDGTIVNDVITSYSIHYTKLYDG